jgi:hypothetical protein
MYLRNKDRQPVGCIAMKIDRKLHSISYQYSVQHPSDVFKKEAARAIATGRLMLKPIDIPLFDHEEINMHLVSEVVMSHISASGAPTRAVKAARLWLADQRYSEH